MNLCVLIPAFNEEKHIAEVISGASRYVEKVIVVDDGSSDGTGERAISAGAEVVVHRKNLGKGAALKTGLTKAFDEGFDPVIIIDGDAQHDWNEIPLFLKSGREGGADIVVGNRMGNARGMPIVRRCINRLTSFLVSKLAKQHIPDSQSGYRLIWKRTFPSISFTAIRYDAEPEMLIEAARAGWKIGSVPIRTIYGTEKSTINPLRDTLKFIVLVIKYWLKSNYSSRSSRMNNSGCLKE